MKKQKWLKIFSFIGVISIALIAFAEDIVNKLGSDTNSSEFQVTNNSGTELFEVEGDGDVGIGTTSPTEKLEVNGNLKMSGGDIKTDRWINHDSNIFIGVGVAGNGSLAHSTGSQGYYNTAIGSQAYYSCTTGWANVAVGYQAMYTNNSGADNTAKAFRFPSKYSSSWERALTR